MKTMVSTLIITLGLGIFSSCGQSENFYAEDLFSMTEIVEDAEYDAKEETTQASPSTTTARFTSPTLAGSANYIATPMSSVFNDDGVHKLIYTADFKFKVKNIPEATSDIETIVIRNGGHLINSTIKSEKSNRIQTNVSSDSTLFTYNEYLTARIELRVPRKQLDAVLKDMAPLAILIDRRTINARDITFDQMDNNLKRIRNADKANRMKGRTYKSDDVFDAENAISEAQENADIAKVGDYRLEDQVGYSTVVVDIYQNPNRYKETVVREISEEEYTPSLFSQFVDALANGWYIICAFIIFLVNIWPIILVLGALAFYYLKYWKKRKSNDTDI